MTTTKRITAVRRELVHRQGGKCARCGQPMDDNVHTTRTRTLSAGAGPALVSAGNMVATHHACTIEPDLVHTFYGNCSDLWGSTGHQASHRGAAKHGICFASRLVPSNVNSYVLRPGLRVRHLRQAENPGRPGRAPDTPGRPLRCQAR